MIEIINLNVSLGGTHILKDINLSIKEEKFDYRNFRTEWCR